MPGKTSSKDRVTTDARPFGFPWLDSCYQETLLPSGPWHKVHTTLCDALAARIGKQFTHPERKQMIFELMGIDFVRKYFPDEPYNPLIIEPPQMSAEARTRLQLDAQNWLQNALSRVCAETGCVRPVADDTGARMSEDTKEFLRHTKFLFNKGMNRQLHLQEKEIEDKWEKAQYDKEKAKEMTQASGERKRLQREHERLYGGVSGPALRGILKPATRLSTGVSTAASQRTHTANVKGAVFGTSEDPPVFTGMQSNSLGRSLAAILKRDPRRSTEVAVKLHGRQLPASLRTYLWIDLLLKHEREKLNDV